MKLSLSKEGLQHLLQGIWRVLRTKTRLHPCKHALLEDCRSVRNVQPDQIGWAVWLATIRRCADTQGDYSSRRRAGDEIKNLVQLSASAPFESRQDGRRNNAPNSSAIDRKHIDATHPVSLVSPRISVFTPGRAIAYARPPQNTIAPPV